MRNEVENLYHQKGCKEAQSSFGTKGVGDWDWNKTEEVNPHHHTHTHIQSSPKGKYPGSATAREEMLKCWGEVGEVVKVANGQKRLICPFFQYSQTIFFIIIMIQTNNEKKYLSKESKWKSLAYDGITNSETYLPKDKRAHIVLYLTKLVARKSSRSFQMK